MSTKSIKLNFEWIIENVTREKLSNSEFSKYSHAFLIKLEGIKTTWRISLERSQPNFIGVYLHLTRSNYTENGIDVKFSALKPHKTDYFTQKIKIGSNWGWPEILTVDELFNPHFQYIDQTCWKINFEMEVFFPDAQQDHKPVNPSMAKHYGDTKLTDFVFTSSDGKDFPVHRVFLTDQSKYFETLFEIKQEKRAKSLRFDDVNSATLTQVLKFIYTGKIEVNDYKMITDVLYAAKKFGHKSLKAFCITKLMDDVKKDNVLRTFAIAEKYKSDELEKKCLKVIMDNYNELEGKISDGDWYLTHGSLMMKITRAFATSSGTPHFTLRTTL